MRRTGNGKWAVDDERARRPRRKPARRSAALAALVLLVVIGSAVAAYLWVRSPARHRPPASPDGPPVYVLGDSFVEADDFQALLGQQLPKYRLDFDGVAGSDMLQQAQRMAELSGNQILVVVDGGFTDADGLADLRAILARVRGECVRWIYVEPPLSSYLGFRDGDAYRRQVKEVEAIRAAYPQQFLATNDRLRSGGDGSESDRADVARGWTPGSLMRDGIHLNGRGNDQLTRLIAARVRQAASDRPAKCREPRRG
jgi:hypothetical protein